jgi:CheY-like chemotaxis protein
MEYLRETREWLSPNQFSESQHEFSTAASMCTHYEKPVPVDLKSRRSPSCESGSSKLKRAKKRGEHVPVKHKPEATVRILVIDDDPIVCDVIKDVLEPHYRIDFALNGRDATRKIKNGPLDLLIMDYHLPGLDGKQLYEWIEANHPALKDSIVFSTGDLFDDNIHTFIEKTGCPCIYKPFSNSHLRKTVSELLGD